jgi:hypothetical protein
MRCHFGPHDLAVRWPGPDNTGVGTCIVNWATSSTCEACERDDVPLACDNANRMDR